MPALTVAEVGEIAGTILGVGAVGAGAFRYAILPATRFGRRVATGLERVEAIWQQLSPNGGHSLADTVASTHRDQVVIKQIVRALASAMDFGTWQSDATGKIVDVNRNTQRICRRSAEELLGNSWVAWVHDDDAEEFVHAWVSAVSGRHAFDRVCRLVLQDGRLQAIRSRADALLDNRGEYLGHFGIVEALGHPRDAADPPPAADDTGRFRRPSLP